MNRILFEPQEVVDNRAVFDDARAEHVMNVLHGAVGQVLKTGVVNGAVGTSVIEAIEPLAPNPETGLARARITVSCTHDRVALAPWVDLILAPPRPRAMKRLLPQLAQMGVGRIVLVGAEKVEKAFWGAQLLKEQIYRPLLLDGLMQAGTTALPTIQVERSFRHYVEKGRFEADFATDTRRVVAHPYADTASSSGRGSLPRHLSADSSSGRAGLPRHLSADSSSGRAGLPRHLSEAESPCVEGGQSPASPRVLVAIGPEGGWTDDEVALLEAHDFARQSLGARILRTDTAVIALLARLMPVE